MKKGQLNESNVDDYIRQKKREGQRRFFWSGNDLRAFRIFSHAIFSDPIIGVPVELANVKYDSDGEIEEWEWKKDFPNKFSFMGVMHYRKK